MRRIRTRIVRVPLTGLRLRLWLIHQQEQARQQWRLREALAAARKTAK